MRRTRGKVPLISFLPAAAALALCLALPATALAQNAEYRSIELTDGRLLRGVVLQSTESGMEVEIPQGVVSAPYDLLANLGVIEQAEVMKQPALRLALAPAVAEGADDRELAREVESWIAEAVGLMPRTEVTDAAAWRSAVGPKDAVRLRACGVDAGCLTSLAASIEPVYLLVPIVEARSGAPSLRIQAYVAATGAQLGEGRTPITRDRRTSAAGVARAAFAACLIEPGFDLDEAAARVFPAPPPVAEAPGVSTTPAEPPPQPVAQQDPIPPTASPAPAPATTAGAAAATRPADSTLGRTIALGFLPVPGLNSAVDGNVPAFVISLAGTVGASWLTIYGVGWTARTEPEFWAPSLLLSYAINVGFNEIVGIIGWHAKRRGTTATAASLRPRPTLSASATPWIGPVAPGRAGATGGAVLLNGRF